MDPFDVVSQELRSHVARATKEDVEREQMYARARQTDSRAEALVWGGLPRAGVDAEDKGKAGGKGKKGDKDKGKAGGKSGAAQAAAAADGR